VSVLLLSEKHASLRFNELRKALVTAVLWCWDVTSYRYGSVCCAGKEWERVLPRCTLAHELAKVAIDTVLCVAGYW